MAEREILLKAVSSIIVKLNRHHPLKVAIDGIDSAGKTIFADELKSHIQKEGWNVIRASLDGFHNPRTLRYARGRESPEGYYIDSFNYIALLDNLLTPLGPGGDLMFRTAIFDYKTDKFLDLPLQKAEKDSILLFDGVFLFRPELIDLWDLKIYLDISYEESLRRGKQRSAHADPSIIQELYLKRYILGQKLYMIHSAPKRKADIIINNNVPSNPKITFLKPDL